MVAQIAFGALLLLLRLLFLLLLLATPGVYQNSLATSVFPVFALGLWLCFYVTFKSIANT